LAPKKEACAADHAMGIFPDWIKGVRTWK